MSSFATAYEQMGYAILSKVAEKNHIGKAIDFMVEHAKDADWSCLERGMKVLEESFQTKMQNPYLDKWMDFIMKEADKRFKQDLIYYAINYDGFRL